MVRHSGEVYRPPAPHFKHEVWATNVLIFSIVSGATVAALRLERTTRRPDLTGYFRNKACLGKGRRSGARHSSTIYSFRFVRRQRLVPRRLSHLLLAPCAADVRKGHLSDKRSSP